MKTFRFIGFALFAILMCLSACSSGGDDPIEPTPKPEVTKSEITIDSSIISNGLSFANDGGEQTISFTTNENWTLNVANTTSGATWCTASATSGSKGTANVKFTVTENTDYDNRSVSVTIKSGTATKTFNISQKSADALLVTTDKYEIAQEGGTIEIEVKANIDYKMEISEKAKEWIKESSSRALTTYKHKLDISKNEDVEKREGEITFISGDKVETVKVYQEADKPMILLSQKDYNVSDKGDTISVDIKSNIDFGVQIPDIDWISDEASSRGLSSHTLKYIVSANEGYDNRSASIIFYDKNSDLKDTLKVVQAQKDALIISKKEIEANAKGEIVEIILSANIDFDVEIINNDWISKKESRALVEHKLYFNVAENTSSNERTGYITFSIKEKESMDTVKISQKPMDYITVACEKYELEPDSKSIDVEITSNTKYNISIENDWISKKNSITDGLTQIISFSIDENNSLEKRSGIITISSEDKSLTKTITIIQKSPVTNSKTIQMKKAGNLWIDISDEEKNLIEGLTIIGDINGTDIKYIREMAGVDVSGNKTKGKLSHLNLEKANIKSGGEAYFDGWTSAGNKAKYYSKNDTINSNMFSKCLSLKNITLPSSVKYIGARAFESCKNLVSIKSFEGLTNYGWYGFYGCEKLKNINFPQSITVLESGAFIGCTSLTEIYLPNTIQEIRNDVFFECSRLTNVRLPESLTEISSRLFGDCTSLTTIEIPANVKKIGSIAFMNCSSLTEIKLPVGVTDLGDYSGSCFLNCTGLKKIEIPNSVIVVKESLFKSCTNLESVTLSNNITEIPASMFENCSNLKSITINEKVESIGNSAFSGCSALSYVSLPKTVQTIGEKAFYYCKKLSSIYSYNPTPPVCKDNSFIVDTYNCKLYVPQNTKSEYAKSNVWKDFENIIEIK